MCTQTQTHTHTHIPIGFVLHKLQLHYEKKFMKALLSDSLEQASHARFMFNHKSFRHAKCFKYFPEFAAKKLLSELTVYYSLYGRVCVCAL